MKLENCFLKKKGGWQEMKRILIVSNNESIIDLFGEYAEGYEETIKIVNEKPAVPITTVSEAIKKIKETDFDVLVIGHKLGGFNLKLICAGTERPEDGEGLEVLRSAEIKNILTGKIVISIGLIPYNNNEVRNLYISAGVKHFISRRSVLFTDMFINLMSCLKSQCDCENP